MTTTTHSRHGTVERHGRRGSIRFERVLAHPVERVWDAITTPEGLAAWWLPFDASIDIDLTAGGLIAFTAPELGEDAMTCEILELDPPHRLVHTHFDRSITLTWELTPDGDGCLLRLSQDTPDIAAALAEGHIVGLHHSLDRLEPALDAAPQAWDWDQLPVIEAEYRSRLLDAYVDGFRAGDHDAILACLTDDVTWDIVGHATARGTAEFDALIDGPEGAGLPRLTLDRTVAQDDVVAAFGTGEFDDADGVTHSFRYADTFTFRAGLICAVESYVVPT
ncbi:SRPBCC domain-containing protein [Nocardioides sp.]|uniref:SRPBCC domain-containing protein n=1 Tax=Nocardioides sp. TaxID=35761 RepID=UPI0025FBC775|nr:SRPBCC domain-containing protein [Nocardioides sp.]